MKKLILSAVAMIVIGIATQASFAQLTSASFISNTKALEKKPLDKNAPAAREAGFLWLTETKDVSVAICGEMMKLIPDKKNKFKSELMMQLTFGMAVFKLENPDQKNDEKAALQAGLESMLRTYEVILAAEKKAQNAELDAFVAKRNDGKLGDVVDAAQCKK